MNYSTLLLYLLFAVDEEQLKRIEEIERKREEERLAQEEQDRRFRKKAVVPDFGLNSFMGEVELAATRVLN